MHFNKKTKLIYKTPKPHVFRVELNLTFAQAYVNQEVFKMTGPINNGI